MKHRLQRRSNLFLMEVILAILFFSIASAVCIRLFAQAHIQSEQAAALNQSVLAASGAAEALEICDGTPDSLTAVFPGSQAEGDTLHVYYDGSWSCCAAADAAWQMDIVLSRDGRLLRGEITVSETGGTEPVYRLTAEQYRGEGL